MSSSTNITLRITVTPQNVTLDVDARAGPDLDARVKEKSPPPPTKTEEPPSLLDAFSAGLADASTAVSDAFPATAAAVFGSHAGPDAYVQVGETKEAPVLLTARADEKEAPPSVYPPHLDGLRTHGDNWQGQPVNGGLIVAIDKLQWSTFAWVAVLVLCALYCGLVCITPKGACQFLLCIPMMLVCAHAMCCAIEGIYINQGYYAKGPAWDNSLGPEPKPRSIFMVLGDLLFGISMAVGFVCSLVCYKHVLDLPSDIKAIDLLIFVPWFWGGFVFDGYHGPKLRRVMRLAFSPPNTPVDGRL